MAFDISTYMNNICIIIHGNNICRNDMDILRKNEKKIRKHNSLATCLHNIFQTPKFSFPYDKQNLLKRRLEGERRNLPTLVEEAIEKRNGNRPPPSGSITCRFPSKHPHPLNTPKYNIKFLHLPRWGNFYARMITASRITWKAPVRGNLFNGENSRKSSSTRCPAGIANRVPVVRREASKRDRFETRDESFGLSTPPAAYYMHTRGFQSFAPRDGAVRGEEGERKWREERKREREKFLALELN